MINIAVYADISVSDNGQKIEEFRFSPQNDRAETFVYYDAWRERATVVTSDPRIISEIEKHIIGMALKSFQDNGDFETDYELIERYDRFTVYSVPSDFLKFKVQIRKLPDKRRKWTDEQRKQASERSKEYWRKVKQKEGD